jgi:2-methylcitrate dehydratase PrpD
MSMQTRALAEFVAGLRFEDIPEDVRARARDCIQDTVGVAVFGAPLPWSRIVSDYARHNGGGGACTILGVAGAKASAPMAALANGAAVHAFEMDCLRKPSAGVHPGGLVPSALAVAEEQGATGRDLITAFVAAMEAATRIGLATNHSSEEKGFHNPGLTGVFGGLVAAGKLLGLDAGQMTNAFGIGGSLCSGLLEFAKSGAGGMVKRLHLGRAAEGGVLAASLARGGFEGPPTVLEGKFGFLNAFADNALPEKLTENLGATWDTRTICFKRCACHATAQGPVQAMDDLRAEAGFGPGDVAEIVLGTSKKVLANHDIRAPADVMGAQYSVPYSLALSFFRDALDPHSFLDADLADRAVLDLCARIRLEFFEETVKPSQNWACRVAVRLNDGRTFERTVTDVRGSPTMPMTPAEFDAKFAAATRALGPERSARLLDGLHRLEEQEGLSGLLALASA